MLDARFSHLYFYQSLNRLQRGLSAIAELLVVLSFKCYNARVSVGHVVRSGASSRWSM